MRLSRGRLAIVLFIALSIAATATFLVVRGTKPHRWAVPATSPGPALRGAPDGEPLLGVNYTHTSFAGCSPRGTGVIADGQQASVGSGATKQLQEMRRNDVEVVRLILWHMSHPVDQEWGVIPSDGGEISEPYRTNLISYLLSARRLGFKSLEISFSPQWTNDPKRSNYDPAKFDENWHFIEAVRSIVERFGPPSRFDLLNEGAPSSFSPPDVRRRLSSYIAEMYSHYARKFGTTDVVISAAGPTPSAERSDRIDQLVAILRETGYPLPTAFEIHLNEPATQATAGLTGASNQLSALGLDQPLIIGEASYDDPDLARVIAGFMRRDRRRIESVIEWYKRNGSHCDVSPPYSVENYVRALRPGN